MDLLIIFALRQHLQPLRKEAATARVQLLPVLVTQLSAERVDGYDECASICLKLKCQPQMTDGCAVSGSSIKTKKDINVLTTVLS